jgi:hypothetical protein
MASIIAAETSAATFLGMPRAIHPRPDLRTHAGPDLGRILVIHLLEAVLHVPRLPVYDLGIRSGRSKNYVSALFLIMRVLASGVRLYVPSLIMVLAWRIFVCPSGGTGSSTPGHRMGDRGSDADRARSPPSAGSRQ